MIWDLLTFAAHDAAISAPLHDAPDDRPSRGEAALDEEPKGARDGD
jgi:hypothetical protein